LRKSSLPRGRCSAVWRFFQESADDKRIVVCNLCHTRMSRGVNTSNLTTTSMIRHMVSKHRNKWEERPDAQSVSAGHTTASSSPVVVASQSPAEGAGPHTSRPEPGRLKHHQRPRPLPCRSAASKCPYPRHLNASANTQPPTHRP